jgi:hypothetical protein
VRCLPRSRAGGKQERINNITESHLQNRWAIQTDLERNTQYTAEIESELRLVERLERAIVNERDCVDTYTADLTARPRRKEQFKRQNYTVVLDRHSNSAAAKRLQGEEEVYAVNVQKVKTTEAMLKQRPSAYEEQSGAIEAHELAVLNCEPAVNEMEHRLTNLGSSFSGTLEKSLQELDALDILATHRRSTAKAHSL